jgi:outer membrane protein
MRISKLFMFFSVLSFIFAKTSTSQEIELNLKTIINDGLRNNIAIVKAQDEIYRQESNIKASYNEILPSLSFNSGWTKTNQVSNGGVVIINGVPVTLGNNNTTNDNFNLSLRTDVTLFNGFANYSRVESAKLFKTVLVSQMEKSKQDVVFKLLSDYITVLKDMKIVLIDSATLEDSRAQLERVKIFVEIGTKTVADIYKQDVIVAQNELAVEQARNNLNKSIADMIFDANMPQDKNYTISGKEFTTDISNETMESYVTKNSTTDPLINNAIRNRYDYKSASQNINVLKVNYDIADDLLLFPTLSGFSSYSFSGNKIGDIANNKVFTIGLTLSYSIFEGFSLDNQRQQALIDLRIANEDLTQLKSQITVDIKKSVLDLKSLLKQIQIADRSLKSTEQDKIAAEEQYKVGLTTLLDVNTAETNYNNALINKSNLVYDFILAEKQLEYLQGLVQY